MKVLITGGTGLPGEMIENFLKMKFYYTHILESKTNRTDYIENLRSRFEIIITRKRFIKKAQIVFHRLKNRQVNKKQLMKL